MIIKETPWEKRNLGVESSAEFYIENNDEVLDPRIINNTNYKYQVAHVPVGKVRILNELINQGFMFMETKIVLIAKLNTISLPNTFERYIKHLDYKEADERELNIVCSIIENAVFTTDKVALDPYFNEQIAGRRYAFWTRDVIKAGQANCYIVRIDNVDIGFFVLKRTNERLADSFLAGLFDKGKDSGWGFSTIYFPILEAKRQGFSKIITGVSSNNPDSLKLHVALGYQIKDIDYTLIKHI